MHFLVSKNVGVRSQGTLLSLGILMTRAGLGEVLVTIHVLVPGLITQQGSL